MVHRGVVDPNEGEARQIGREHVYVVAALELVSLARYLADRRRSALEGDDPRIDVRGYVLIHDVAKRSGAGLELRVHEVHIPDAVGIRLAPSICPKDGRRRG